MIYGKTTQELLDEACRWKPWFAWYPVCLDDGRRVWMERVERRTVFGRYDSWTSYRMPKKASH